MVCKILTGATVRIGVPGFLVKHQRSFWGNHLNEGGHLAAKQRKNRLPLQVNFKGKKSF